MVDLASAKPGYFCSASIRDVTVVSIKEIVPSSAIPRAAYGRISSSDNDLEWTMRP